MIADPKNTPRSERDRAEDLLTLARVVAAKGHRVRAWHMCLEAMTAIPGDPLMDAQAHRLLETLIPRYHIPMLTDARRNSAWDRALRRAIRPGAHVLEIGSGAGLLAILAARAGAARVVTCERDPLMAAVARTVVSLNGAADRVTVVEKPSQELQLGVDLERPADLLFFDLFTNSMMALDPLNVLSDARRLLAPDAVVLPNATTILAALADWRSGAGGADFSDTMGVDLSPMKAFLPHSVAITSSADLSLLSQAADVFRFDLCRAAHPDSDQRSIDFHVTTGGSVNGIVQWIRLDLDGTETLEGPPGTPGRYFLHSKWHPFPHPRDVRAGDVVSITAQYQGNHLTLWA